MPGTLRASNIGRSNGLIVAFFLLVCSLGREACRVSMSLVTVHTMCVHRCTIIRCTIDRFLLTPFLFFFLSFFLVELVFVLPFLLTFTLEHVDSPRYSDTRFTIREDGGGYPSERI